MAISSRVVKKLCVGPDHGSPQPRATALGQQQHPTPPRGQLRGRHVAREDDIVQGINSESRPYGKVPDPCIYRPDLRVRSRTSTGANRTPRMGSGPLCVGSGPLIAGSRDSETKNAQALIKARRGSRADTCLDHTVYASAPRSCRAPMLPRGMIHVT
jgi:hypothetical protein